MAALLAVIAWAHADNLFSYPAYFLDEGTYISRAWALLHGQLAPFGYYYDHPPMGWALIAVWTQLTGGFFRFGSAIDSGRVLILVIVLLSALLVYLIARHLTRQPLLGGLAAVFYALSPIGIPLQRFVLLDTIAAFWILVALYLLMIGAGSRTYLVVAALSFGVACLSKETVDVLLPVFMYAAWLYTPLNRRSSILIFTAVALIVVALYPLYAALRGELLPHPFLGIGTHPQVSLLREFHAQALRGSSQGSFLRAWSIWWHADNIFMAVGVVAMVGNLIFSRGRPYLRIVALLSICYWAFLARGGVTYDFYVLPLIPLQALNIGLFVDNLLQLARRQLPPQLGGLSSSRILSGVVLLLTVVVAVRGISTMYAATTVDATRPQKQALHWIVAHAPRSSVVIVSDYNWVDMYDAASPLVHRAPFDRVQPYWTTIGGVLGRDGRLRRNWRNIGFVIADYHMQFDLSTPPFSRELWRLHTAILHARVARAFGHGGERITIYRAEPNP